MTIWHLYEIPKDINSMAILGRHILGRERHANIISSGVGHGVCIAFRPSKDSCRRSIRLCAKKPKRNT